MSEYVRPNEDIETAVAKFYGKLTAPVATALKLDLPGSEVNRVYPKELPDLFAGGQVIAVGRYHGSGDAKIKLAGKGARLEPPALPLTAPVSIQLHNLESGLCWSSDFDRFVTRNDPESFRARSE